jgi:hypothetical protein
MLALLDSQFQASFQQTPTTGEVCHVRSLGCWGGKRAAGVLECAVVRHAPCASGLLMQVEISVCHCSRFYNFLPRLLLCQCFLKHFGPAGGWGHSRCNTPVREFKCVLKHFLNPAYREMGCVRLFGLLDQTFEFRLVFDPTCQQRCGIRHFSINAGFHNIRTLKMLMQNGRAPCMSFPRVSGEFTIPSMFTWQMCTPAEHIKGGRRRVRPC